MGARLAGRRRHIGLNWPMTPARSTQQMCVDKALGSVTACMVDKAAIYRNMWGLTWAFGNFWSGLSFRVAGSSRLVCEGGKASILPFEAGMSRF